MPPICDVLAAACVIAHISAAAVATDVRYRRLADILSEAASNDTAHVAAAAYDVPTLEFHADGFTASAQELMLREVPFVVRGAPGAASASFKWSAAYLRDRVGAAFLTAFDGETFHNTPSMYGRQHMSVDESQQWWRAWDADVPLHEYAEQHPHVNGSSVYLQLSSTMWPWLATDVSEFTAWRRPRCAPLSPPTGGCVSEAEAVFIGDVGVSANTDVECRFGLAGTRIEAHFDTYSNWVALLAGFRRIVLAPPTECTRVAVSRALARQRHSVLDWASPTTWVRSGFKDAVGTMVVLGPGDVLYVPPYWFHSIHSLTHTAQCSKMSRKAVVPLAALHCVAFHTTMSSSEPVAASDDEHGDDAFNDPSSCSQLASSRAPEHILSRWLLRNATLAAPAPATDVGVVLAALAGHLESIPWLSMQRTPYSDLHDVQLSSFWKDVLALVGALPAVKHAHAHAPDVSATFLWQMYRYLSCDSAFKRGAVAAVDLRLLLPAHVDAASQGATGWHLHACFIASPASAPLPGLCTADAPAPLTKPVAAAEAPQHGTVRLRLLLHFMGSPEMVQAVDAKTIRADPTLAAEVAVYTIEAVVDASNGRVLHYRRTTSMFALPTYHGPLGMVRRIASNIAALGAGGSVPWRYMGSVYSSLIAPVLLPIASTLLLMGCVCRMHSGAAGMATAARAPAAGK